jgi:hypothetical protein
MASTTTRQVVRPSVFLWPDGKKSGCIDLSRYCSGFNYEKALNQPIGQWSLSVLPFQGTKGPTQIGQWTEIERKIRPNAVVSIGFDEPGGICLGLVDQVQRTRTLRGGQARMGLELHGGDFGKILAMDHIVHASLTVGSSPDFLAKLLPVVGPNHALVAALPGVWGPTTGRDAVPTFLATSVDTVVNWILENGASVQVPLLAAAGGSGKPTDYIRSESITTWNDSRIWSEAPHTFQGTLWDFLRRILDEDFYELIIDTRPNGRVFPDVVLTIRPKPFDEFGLRFLPQTEDPGLSWEDLRTRVDELKDWEIPQEQILSEQLGMSDADVFSYYQVTAENELIGNPDGLKEGLFYPAVDLFALTRAGLRAYEGRLSLVASDLVAKQAGELDYDREVGTAIVEFRNRLVNWYRLSEYFEAGSITVTGRDRYRVGDPVSLPWRLPMRGDRPGVRYYCTSTSHQWQLGGPYTTTMRLTRGHNASVIARAQQEIALVGTPFGNPTMMAAT